MKENRESAAVLNTENTIVMTPDMGSDIRRLNQQFTL
jgi:hypothetical protein